jgi:hypothetical protein
MTGHADSVDRVAARRRSSRISRLVNMGIEPFRVPSLRQGITSLEEVLRETVR